MKPLPYAAAPLVRHAAVVLAPGAVGELPDAPLRNPFRSAWYLDEMRFSTGWLTDFGNAVQSTVSLGAIRGKLSIAGQELTRGYVPLWSLGKVVNDGIVQSLGADGPGPVQFPNIMTPIDRYCSWVLPKPMFIAPGEFIKASFWFDNVTGFLAGTTPGTKPMLHVMFLGRSIPSDVPYPETVDLPWVTFYETAFVAPGSAVLNQKSLDNVLSNPFDQPLHVERFIGRLPVSLVNYNAYVDYPGSSGESDKASAVDLGMQYTTVKMTDSLGHILVRDPTPFGLLFDALDRSWTCKAVLPPRSFVSAIVNQNYTNAFATDPSAAVHLSMIGCRTVALKDIGFTRQDPFSPALVLPSGVRHGQLW